MQEYDTINREILDDQEFETTGMELALPTGMSNDDMLFYAQFHNPRTRLLSAVNTIIHVVGIAWGEDVRRSGTGVPIVNTKSGVVEYGMRTLILTDEGVLYTSMSPIAYRFFRSQANLFCPTGMGKLSLTLPVKVSLYETKKNGYNAYQFSIATLMRTSTHMTIVTEEYQKGHTHHG